MARLETIVEGAYVHVLNRGVKKTSIYRQKSDLWRLLFNLFYLNSKKIPDNWNRVLNREDRLRNFVWLKEWGKKVPLVSVLAYTIMPNHFHLILKEINKGGISQFMHKFSMGYSKFVNTKYKETGSLFQGPFKSVVVKSDNQLRYLATYVMVKNPFELYPKGGIEGAMKNFDDAWKWASNYPFCSLVDYAGGRDYSVVLDKDLLGEIFVKPKVFKDFARDCILGRKLGVGEQDLE